jgi:hypothetical protein
VLQLKNCDLIPYQHQATCTKESKRNTRKTLRVIHKESKYHLHLKIYGND